MPDKKAEAMRLLQQAVEDFGTIQAVAVALDVSRTAISLTLADKYKGNPSLIYDRAIARFSGWECLHTCNRITPADCHSHCLGQPPVQNPSAMRHYRTCQGCVHNPLKDQS